MDPNPLWQHHNIVHLQGPELWPRQAQPTSSAGAPARAAEQWHLLLPQRRRLLPHLPAAVHLPLQLLTPRPTGVWHLQQVWLGAAALAEVARQ